MGFTAKRAGLAALLLATGSCEIPQDPRHTLEEARNDTLHVGVSEAPPWVIKSAAASTPDPEGVEAALVRQFARSIGAEIRWSWGTPDEHMKALELYELDIAIGGLVRGTPWSKLVGTTQPYHVSRIMIAGPPGSGSTSRDAMEGRPVAVPAGGPIAGWIRQEGGEPRPVEDLASFDGIVGAPDWKLVELGRDTTGYVLTRVHHIMATPPGENALIMALEDVLHRADVPSLLQRAAGPGGAP
jgi:ABC-type amino acid transport substrate-binding protein